MIGEDLPEGRPLFWPDPLGVVYASCREQGLLCVLAKKATDHQGAEDTATASLIESENPHPYLPEPAATPALSTVISSVPGASSLLPFRAS